MAVWQQQQMMQGGHLSFGGMHGMAGGHPGQRVGAITPVHHPQLYGLPPQMVSPQIQMGSPQMQMGMPPQHHHHVGGSPLQPAQFGAPPLHAGALPTMQARRM